MEPKFLKSSINITIFIGAILSMYFLQFSLKDGLSILGGVLFSIANIYLLWKLVQEVITTEERNAGNIAGLVVLKFLILWGAFIAVMALGWGSPVHLAIGFSVLLAVFSLKGFGGWMINYFGKEKGL